MSLKIDIWNTNFENWSNNVSVPSIEIGNWYLVKLNPGQNLSCLFAADKIFWSCSSMIGHVPISYIFILTDKGSKGQIYPLKIFDKFDQYSRKLLYHLKPTTFHWENPGKLPFN